jgi:hypothetical protein
VPTSVKPTPTCKHHCRRSVRLTPNVPGRAGENCQWQQQDHASSSRQGEQVASCWSPARGALQEIQTPRPILCACHVLQWVTLGGAWSHDKGRGWLWACTQGRCASMTILLLHSCWQHRSRQLAWCRLLPAPWFQEELCQY